MDTPAHVGHSNDSEPPTSDYHSNDPATYFVACGDTTAGPYTADELKARLATGVLTLESHVCIPGWGEWRRLADVPELSKLGIASTTNAVPHKLAPASPAIPNQNSTAAKVLLCLGLLGFVVLAVGAGAAELLGMVVCFVWLFCLGRAGLWLLEKFRPGATKKLAERLKRMGNTPGPQPLLSAPNPSLPVRMWLRRSDDTQVEYSVEELRLKLASGAIAGSDYVWQQGWLGWRKIADVDSLAPTTSVGPIPLMNPIPRPTVSGGRSWVLATDRFSRWLAGSLSAVSPAQIRPLLRERQVRIGLTIALILAVLWFALPPAYEQLKQASQARDPLMAQRTAEAWRTLSAIEIETSQSGDPRRRLILLSQMELNNVDPLLTEHIRQTGDAAKVFAELSNRIDQEVLRQNAESTKATELIGMLGGVVGLLGSARGSSPETIQRNMALGQQVGDLGARLGGVFDDLQSNSRLQAKFGQEIAAFQSEAARLDRERKQLAERLGQKYRRPFLIL